MKWGPLRTDDLSEVFEESVRILFWKYKGASAEAKKKPLESYRNDLSERQWELEQNVSDKNHEKKLNSGCVLISEEVKNDFIVSKKDFSILFSL